MRGNFVTLHVLRAPGAKGESFYAARAASILGTPSASLTTDNCAERALPVTLIKQSFHRRFARPRLRDRPTSGDVVDHKDELVGVIAVENLDIDA